MPKSFFISDVHLTANHSELEKTKEKKLLSFLDYCAKYGERLIIVGDLFDFWFEYRTVIPRGFSRIFCALARLSDLQKDVHYITGNHDFWMRNYLTSEFQVHLHFDKFTPVIDQKKFYIFHGDGLAKNDYGYRILKKIFRNKINIFLYSLLHPDIGIPLAKRVSALSRKHTSKDGLPEDQDYFNKATDLFNEGYDIVVCGHLHSPKIKKVAQKTYLNLGDWIEHFTFAEYENGDLSLKTWTQT
jgi:UDP-2,3-diacylglucosamine hydrolase